MALSTASVQQPPLTCHAYSSGQGPLLTETPSTSKHHARCYRPPDRILIRHAPTASSIVSTQQVLNMPLPKENIARQWELVDCYVTLEGFYEDFYTFMALIFLVKNTGIWQALESTSWWFRLWEALQFPPRQLPTHQPQRKGRKATKAPRP